MSKSVNIQTLQPVVNGPIYGQKARTQDFKNVQIFAHKHIENVTQDFIGDEKSVTGFNYTLGGGNTRQINILAPGRAYDADGIQYDFETDTTLTIQAADAVHPRLDIIVAVMEKDVSAASEAIPFARIRTQAELEQNVSPFIPTQFNNPSQKNNTATVRVITGVATSIPVAPAPGANEVLLYQVSVAANSVSVVDADITDKRPIVKTLRELTTLLDEVAGTFITSGDGTKFLADNGNYRTLTASLISDFNTAADARADARIAAAALQPISAKNQANGYAGLDGSGLINPAQIPALKSHEFVVVANQAARLALTAVQVQLGDEAFQTDTGETYKLISADPSQNASWKMIADTTPDWSVIANKPANLMSIGGGVTGATDGSVLFAGAGGNLTQNNADLFYDRVNSKLGLGVNAALQAKLHVISTTEQLRLGYDAAKYSRFTVDSNGNLSIINIGGKIQLGSTDMLLQFGGTDNNFAALKANGKKLQVRLADDSDVASFITGELLYRGRQKNFPSGTVLSPDDSGSIIGMLTGEDVRLPPDAPSGVCFGVTGHSPSGSTAKVKFPNQLGLMQFVTPAGSVTVTSASYITINIGFIEIISINNGAYWFLKSNQSDYVLTV